MHYKKENIIGMTEIVTIRGKSYKARIDTGASLSSIDKRLAKKLNLGPIIKKVKVKSVHGRTKRPIIKEEIIIKDKKIEGKFNLADRSKMKYKILIGRDILNKGFLIDTTKK